MKFQEFSEFISGYLIMKSGNNAAATTCTAIAIFFCEKCHSNVDQIIQIRAFKSILCLYIVQKLIVGGSIQYEEIKKMEIKSEHQTGESTQTKCYSSAERISWRQCAM